MSLGLAGWASLQIEACLPVLGPELWACSFSLSATASLDKRVSLQVFTSRFSVSWIKTHVEYSIVFLAQYRKELSSKNRCCLELASNHYRETPGTDELARSLFFSFLLCLLSFCRALPPTLHFFLLSAHL